MFNFENVFSDIEVDNGASSYFSDSTFDDIDSNDELRSYLHRTLDEEGTRFNGDTQKLKDYIQNEGTRTMSSLALSGADYIASGLEDEGEKKHENLIGRLYESSENRLTSGDFGKTVDALYAGVQGQVVDLGAMLLAAPLTGGMSVIGGVGAKAGTAARWAARAVNPLSTSGNKLAARALSDNAVKTALAKGDTALATKLASKGIMTGSMKRHAAKGALSEAAFGVAASSLTQGAQMNRELRDEFSTLDAGIEATAGAAFGGLLGGVVGGFASRGIRDELTGVKPFGNQITNESLTIPGAEKAVRNELETSINAEIDADQAAKLGGDRTDVAEDAATNEVDIPELPLFGEGLTSQLRDNSEMTTTAITGQDGDKNLPGAMRRVARSMMRNTNHNDPRGFTPSTVRRAAALATGMRETLAGRLERMHSNAVLASNSKNSVEPMDVWIERADDLTNLHRIAYENPRLLDEIDETGVVPDALMDALAATDDKLSRMMGADRQAKIAAEEAKKAAKKARKTKRKEDRAAAAAAEAEAAKKQAEADEAAKAADEPPTGDTPPAEGGAPSPSPDGDAPPLVDPTTGATPPTEAAEIAAEEAAEEAAAAARKKKTTGTKKTDGYIPVSSLRESEFMDADGDEQIAILEGMIDDARAGGEEIDDIDTIIASSDNPDDIELAVEEIHMGIMATDATTEITEDQVHAAVTAAVARAKEARAAYDKKANADADAKIGDSPEVKAEAAAQAPVKSTDDNVHRMEVETFEDLEIATTTFGEINTPEALEQMKLHPRVGWLAEEITPEMIATAEGRETARTRIQQRAHRQVGIDILDVMSRTESRLHDGEAFTKALDEMAELSPAAKKIVRQQWEDGMRYGVASRLAERLKGDAPEISAADVDGWAQWTNESNTRLTRRARITKENFNAMIDEEVPVTLSENARKFVLREVRELRQRLQNFLPLAGDETVEIALRQRARDAASEIAVRDWRTEMPDLAQVVDKYKSLKAEAEEAGQTLAQYREALALAEDMAKPLHGRMVDAPIRHLGQLVTGRMIPYESADGKGIYRGLGGPQAAIRPEQMVFVDENGGMRSYSGRAASSTGSAAAIRSAWRGIVQGGMAARDKKFSRVLRLGDQVFVSKAGDEKLEAMNVVRMRLLQKWLMDREVMGEDEFQKKLAVLNRESGMPVSDAEMSAIITMQDAQKHIDAAHAEAEAAVAEIDPDLPPEHRAAELADIDHQLELALHGMEARVTTAVKKVMYPKKRRAAKGEKEAEAEVPGDPSVMPEGVVTVWSGTPKSKNRKKVEVPSKAVVFADGKVTFLNEVIGTYVAKGNKRTVTINGMDKPAEGITDPMSLLKRSKVRAAIQSKIDAEVARLREARSQTGDDGDVISTGQSQTGKTESAAEKLGIGEDKDAILNTPFAKMGELPDGLQWAIRMDDTGEIRRVYPSQETPGQALGDYPGGFTVGTLPSYRFKRNRAYTSTDGSEAAVDWTTANFAAHNADKPRSVNPQVANYARRVRDAKGQSPVLLKAQGRSLRESEAKKIVLEDGRTLVDLYDQFSDVSMMVSTKEFATRKKFDAIMAKLTEDASLLESLLPHGIHRSNASPVNNNVRMRTSATWLNEIMGKRSQAEIDSALTVLRRIDSQGNAFPRIEPNNESMGGAFFGDINSVVLRAGDEGATAYTDKNGKVVSVLPAHEQMVHELGHWAYTNILTPSEQIEFLSTLKQYFGKDGKFDMKAAMADTPYLSDLKSKGVTFQGADTRLNELFAWQFSHYYQKKIADPSLDDTLWKKVVAKVRNLLEAIRGKPIKPELIPLFERILPTSVRNKRYHYGSLKDVISGETVDVSLINDEAGRSAMRVLDSMEKMENLRIGMDRRLFDATSTGEELFAENMRAANHLSKLLLGGVRTLTARKVTHNLKYDEVQARRIEALFGETGIGLINRIRVSHAERMKEAGMTDEVIGAYEDADVGGDLGLVALNLGSNPEAMISFEQQFKRGVAEAVEKGMDADGQTDYGMAYALNAIRDDYPEIVDSIRDSSGGAGTQVKVVDAETTERYYRLGLELRDLLHDATDTMQAMIPAVSGRQYYPVRSNLRTEKPLAPAERKKVSAEIEGAAKKRTTPQDRMEAQDIESLVREGRAKVEAAVIEARKAGTDMARAMAKAANTIKPYLREVRRRIESAPEWPKTTSHRYEHGTQEFDEAFGTDAAADMTMRDALAVGDLDTIIEAGAIIRKMRGITTETLKAGEAGRKGRTAESATGPGGEHGPTGSDGMGQPPRRHPAVAAIVAQISTRDPLERQFSQNLMAELLTRRGIETPLTHGQLMEITGAKAHAAHGPNDSVQTTDAPFANFRNRMRKLAQVARKASNGESDAPDMAKAIGEIGEWLMPASARGTGKQKPSRVIADLYLARKRGKLSDEQKTMLKDDPEIADAFSEAINVINDAMIGPKRADMDAGRVTTDTGLHPDFAAMRGRVLLDSLDDEEMGAVSAALGMSYSTTTRAQIDQGVLYRNVRTGAVTRQAQVHRITQKDLPDGDEDATALLAELNRTDERLRDRHEFADDAEMDDLMETRKNILLAIEDRSEKKLDDGLEVLLVNPEAILRESGVPTKAELIAVARTAVESSQGKLSMESFGTLIRETPPVSGDMTRVLSVISNTLEEKGANKVLSTLGYVAREAEDGAITTVNAQKMRSLEDHIPEDRYYPEELITGEGFGDALFMKAINPDPEVKLNSYGLENAALEQGHSSRMSKAITSIITGRWTKKGLRYATDPRQQKLVQIRDNPSRMRKYDAHALADTVKTVYGGGFHVDRKLKMAELYAPVETLLNGLDGIKGQVSNSAHVLRNIWTPNRDRPSLRIGEALQAGEKAVAKLSPDERVAARKLVEQYRKAHEEMRRHGIEVGDVVGNGQDFYQPQRMRVAEITKHREEAIEDFTKLFIEDGTPHAQAVVSARKMVHTAIEAEDAGGFTEMPEFRSAVGREMHKRVLNIGNDRMAAGMSRWFETDARSLSADYFASVANRIESVKRWGVDNHGVDTYIDIGKRGSVAVVEMLTRKRMRVGATLPDGPDAGVAFERVLYDALVDTPEEAQALVNSIERAIMEAPNPAAIKETTRQLLIAEYGRRQGANPQYFAKQAEWIAAGIADFSIHGNALTSHEAKFLVDAIAAQQGKGVFRIGADNHKTRAAANGLAAVNAVTLLPYATVSSFSDLTMPLIRGGQFGAAVKGLVGGAKSIAKHDPARKEAMMRLGISTEQAAQESMMMLNGDAAGKLTTSFFHLNFLTPWTNANREISATVGFEVIKNHQITARRLKAKGLANLTGMEKVKFRSTMRNLRELGVGHLADDVENGATIPELGDFVDMAMNGDERVRAAVHRFVDESTFQPNRSDIPLWGQDPIGRIPFQLKSYMLMFQRMTRRVLREATALEKGELGNGDLVKMSDILRNPKQALTGAKFAGDWRPLAALATVGAGVGMLTEQAKDVARFRNQEADDDPGLEWSSVQDRSLAKMLLQFGRDEDAGEAIGDGDKLVMGKSADEIAGWYLEGMMSLGALGMVGQMIHDAAQQTDNGAYGKLRTISIIAGPAAGVVTDALDVANWGAEAATEAVFGGESEATGTARQGARTLIKRVPFVGGNMAAREALTTQIAGEPSR